MRPCGDLGCRVWGLGFRVVLVMAYPSAPTWFLNGLVMVCLVLDCHIRRAGQLHGRGRLALDLNDLEMHHGCHLETY